MSPTKIWHIISRNLETVQDRRYVKLNLESLELRRLRADLTLVYKILFGVIHTKSDKLFSLRNQPQLRGHNYILNKPRCSLVANNIGSLLYQYWHIGYKLADVTILVEYWTDIVTQIPMLLTVAVRQYWPIMAQYCTWKIKRDACQ